MKKPVGEGDVGVPPQTPAGGSRNLNRRPGHCRARASFRLTPAFRFALRASAHRAQANLRPPAPRSLGLRPKGVRVWGRHSALALSPHLGLRPKPLARGLNSDKKKTPTGRHLCGVSPSGCRKTPREVSEGRSSPTVFRPQRHARWGRKPCVARFPYTVCRPASRRRVGRRCIPVGKDRRRRAFSTR